MKNILLFLFLLISLQTWSQNNEITLHFSTSNLISQQNSLSYFRNIADLSAIGIKLNYQEQKVNQWHGEDQRTTIRVDIVQRFHIIKSQKIFRLYGDLGLAVKRHQQDDPTMLGFPISCFGPVIRPSFDASMDLNSKFEVNYLGISSSIGADIRFLKRFTFGLDLSHRYFFTNNFEHQELDIKDLNSPLSSLNCNINLGVKF